MQLGSFEFCSQAEKQDWERMENHPKTLHLIGMIIHQLQHMKSYIKPLGEDINQYLHEGEIQNVLKMSIAIIGKYLTLLKRECGFNHPALRQEIFKLFIRKGIDVSHKIGEDIEYYEFDEIDPRLIFKIAMNAETLIKQFESMKN